MRRENHKIAASGMLISILMTIKRNRQLNSVIILLRKVINERPGYISNRRKKSKYDHVNSTFEKLQRLAHIIANT